MTKLLTLAMMLAAAVALMALAACDGGRFDGRTYWAPDRRADWRAYPTTYCRAYPGPDWRGHAHSNSWDHPHDKSDSPPNAQGGRRSGARGRQLYCRDPQEAAGGVRGAGVGVAVQRRQPRGG